MTPQAPASDPPRAVVATTDPLKAPGTYAAIASLSLGLVSLLTWWACLGICTTPLALAGVFLGWLALPTPRHAMALTGMTMSAVSLVTSIGYFIFWLATK